MEKRIIHLVVPAVNFEVDICVPGILSVKELTDILIDGVNEFSNQKYCPSGEEILCLKGGEVLFNKESCIGEYSIQNGDYLYMI